MHFIFRSKCPQLLVKNKDNWTTPWVAHYRWKKGGGDEAEQPKKPSDGRWRDDEIRLVLIKDYHNNCGYCGESLPTPIHTKKQNIELGIEFASKGDVDHLTPKAIEPEQVYEWLNYVWSCKPCNQLKNEFHSTSHPLLNPNNNNDCDMLVFIEDAGNYALHNTVINDTDWQKRFQNSERKTLMNAEEICQKRRLKTSTLRQRFQSIVTYLDMLKQIATTPENTALAERVQCLLSDSLIEIKDVVSTPDFYCLIQNNYELQLKEHPQIAKLLAENTD